MIRRVLPPETVRGRLARAAARAVCCLHPVASKRTDAGDVVEALSGEYPYRFWLRAQRRRRGLRPGPAPSEAGIDCCGGDDDRFEPDAAQLIAGALDAGARGVVFHHDIDGRPGTVRIVATPGPVSDHLHGGSGPAGLCRRDGAERSRTPWREVQRIDELLVHRGPHGGHPGGESTGGQAGHPSPPPSDEPISVVVPSPANTTLLERFFEGLSQEDCVAEVVVVDNSVRVTEADEFYDRWRTRLPLHVLRTDPGDPFNYSRANNLGAAASTGAVLAFCNDDLEFISHPTLTRLAGWLSVPDLGVAGPQLRYPDGTIQHGGVVLGLNGLAEHAFTGMTSGSDTLIGNTDHPRDVSAVTGACLITSRAVFDEVGGFDEELRLTGSDVWFCLQAAERGAHTVYDGSVALVHHESLTRGETNHITDVVACVERWGHRIDAGDPYWSQLLAVNNHEPALRRRGDPDARAMLTDHLERHGVPGASVR